MKLLGIIKRLFKRDQKTILLDSDTLFNHRLEPTPLFSVDDKAIFEIIHTVSINENGTLISGRIKRGYFMTGDKIAICNPTETTAKIEATIINIKTILVDVNRINSGAQADFILAVYGDESLILPGDRVYKINNKIQVSTSSIGETV